MLVGENLENGLTPFYDKKETCLLCSKEFTTKKIRSKFVKVEETDSDFFVETVSQKLNPVLYYIAVCPNCGYSFNEHSSNFFPPLVKEQIKKEIGSRWKFKKLSEERTITHSIISYKIAIYIGHLKKERAIVMAGMCIRLAWLYRMLQNIENEVRFLRLSLEFYQESFAIGDYQRMNFSEMKLLYIIGELYRRIGDNSQAIKFFSKVTTHPNGKYETVIKEKAREQWYLIREKRNIN